MFENWENILPLETAGSISYYFWPLFYMKQVFSDKIQTSMKFTGVDNLTSVLRGGGGGVVILEKKWLHEQIMQIQNGSFPHPSEVKWSALDTINYLYDLFAWECALAFLTFFLLHTDIT